MTADTQPILASRVARLRLHPRKPFGAVNVSFGWFGREAKAGCQHRQVSGHDRISPDPTCSCGFYSVTRDEYYPGPLLLNQVRLDVELAGRVMIYGRGYRSHWQRVLAVRVPPCFLCGARRDAPFRVVGSGDLYFLCPGCGGSLLTPTPGDVRLWQQMLTGTYPDRDVLAPCPAALVRELLPVGFAFEGGKGWRA